MTWRTMIGVATLGVALLPGLVAAQDAGSPARSTSEPEVQGAGDAALTSVSSGLNHAMQRSFGGRTREQPLTAPTPRVGRFFLQGGVYGCCEGQGAGFVLGGGGFASPSANLRILGDAHAVGEPGYGAGFYGSGTVALRFGDPAADRLQGLVGVGLAVLADGGSGQGGPQVVAELGYKAGFFQYRVAWLSEHNVMAMLLAGWKFSSER